MKTINALLYRERLDSDDRGQGSRPYQWIAQGLEINSRGIGDSQNHAIALLLSDYTIALELAKRREKKLFEKKGVDEFVNDELSKIFLSDKNIRPRIGYINRPVKIKVHIYNTTTLKNKSQ